MDGRKLYILNCINEISFGSSLLKKVLYYLIMLIFIECLIKFIYNSTEDNKHQFFPEVQSKKKNTKKIQFGFNNVY